MDRTNRVHWWREHVQMAGRPVMRTKPPRSGLILGLDYGTSGVRAVLFDTGWQPRGSGEAGYRQLSPRPRWAEQDPVEIYDAGCLTIRRALADANADPSSVLAVGISTILATLIAFDSHGEPLTSSWYWADSRSHAEVNELIQAIGADDLYRRTGCGLHPMYSHSKLVWLKKHMPDVFASAAGFGTIKEYILRRLTGEWAVDMSIASGTGIYDTAAKTWHQEVLAFLGIPTSRLGRLVEGDEMIGRITDAASAETGLVPGTPVVAGGADGPLASLGTGTVRPGRMTLMIGSSGAVRTITNRPVVDPQRRTWCYYLCRDRWVPGAAINNAGIVAKWAADLLVAEPGGSEAASGVQELERLARSAPAGAGGLLFLPYLTGERSPYWNADARGVLFGLAIEHGPAHIARAAFEGVGFRMRTNLDVMEELVGPATKLLAAGGFTRSEFWVQLQADMLQRRLTVTDAEQASAFGAAYLAGMHLGVNRSLEEIDSLVRPLREVEPDPTNAGLYDRLYALYTDLYHRLAPKFAEIASLQEDSAGERPA